MVIILSIFGILLGVLANFCVAVLAWNPKKISPWCSLPSKIPARLREKFAHRSPLAYIPIIGWWFMRNEEEIHGRYFWIRPMIVELLMGLFTVYFYHFVVTSPAILGESLGFKLSVGEQISLNVRFFVQMALVFLMLAASLIDIDEKSIPDSITVTGTLFALLVSFLFPVTLPIYDEVSMESNMQIQPPAQLYFFPEMFWEKDECGHALLYPLTVSAPYPTTQAIMRENGTTGLWLGIACWWGWLFALADRRWCTRHGWKIAISLFVRKLRRAQSTQTLLMFANFGTLLIFAVWYLNGENWFRLCQTLMSLAIAGGALWLLRIFSSIIMKREALGFGDVILFAMLGAFLGWQPCLVLFFIAPFAALVVGILMLIFAHDTEVPYGPFLCIAALVTIFNWEFLWKFLAPIFELGGTTLLWGAAGCLVLMGILLFLIQLVKRCFGIQN